jgi:hypothetical protein
MMILLDAMLGEMEARTYAESNKQHDSWKNWQIIWLPPKSSQEG